MNLGRNQLIAWVNQVMQCEYVNVQMLADGVAYSQLLEAVHPGCINITRISMSTRYPDDCLRNLRILESALKKLKITTPVSFEKMSQGKFQDNINFLQWIYNYTMKNGQQSLPLYQAYNRRIDILDRQGKSIQQINPHLIPNEAYLEYEGEQASSGDNFNEDTSEYEHGSEYQQQYNYVQNKNTELSHQLALKKEQLHFRSQQVKEDCIHLQNQMKAQMETNWKLMHNTERSIEDRNTLYSLLKQIQTIVKQTPSSSVGAEILKILSDTSEDFK